MPVSVAPLVEQLAPPVLTAYVTAPVPLPPVVLSADVPLSAIFAGAATATSADCVPLPTETLTLAAAARYVASPDLVAVMTHVPAPMPVTVVPEIAQKPPPEVTA